MKKKFTKIASCLLCLAMLVSIAAPAVAAAAEARLYDDLIFGPEMEIIDDEISIDAPDAEESSASTDSLPTDPTEASLLADVNPFDATGEYEIYPTPHSVTYGTSTVTLPETMQVTYTGDIDDYTKARAVEAFEQAGVTLDETSTTDVKLQVRIDATFSTKTSAHTVTVDANGVTVVGVDTDAAFYGLTTVKRILQQVTDKQVKHLTVEDYADVPFRGFIEGYYGNPWTTEDRVSLMKFGGDYKQNIYFYAPKDDPKHNAKWREKYTTDELNTKIAPLAVAGNESKCYFGFALHPFMSNAIRFDTEANYQADLTILKEKFEQAMGVGVRQIAILADDASVPTGGAASYVKLMKDLTDWVSSSEMQTKYRGLKTSIPFCPADYGGNGSSAELQTLKQLPDSVPVIMTGGQVWGHVEHKFLDTYRTNMDNGPFLWVNWPCTDNSKTVLTMGGHDSVLQDDLTADDIAAIKGIMLNPMQQSEPSKAAIFQNADYSWNIWTSGNSAERTAKVWNDCFKYVDHDSAIETDESAALRELSKHMIHQYKRTNGSYHKYYESIELSPKLTAFREKMAAGTLTADEITSMRSEFQKLYDAAVLYKNKSTGNTRILGQRNDDGTYVDNQEQMAPWLDTWEDFTSATLDLLDALASDDSNTIVTKYLSGQSKLDASRKHGFFYVNYTEYANVGGQHLIPFTQALLSALAEKVSYLLSGQEEPLKETIITSRTDVADLSALRDGDDSTKITFTNPTSLSRGDYLGVIYSRPISLASVNFKLGDTSADGGKNTFGACKLQYTEDGTTWVDIPGEPTIVNNTMNSSWNGTCRVAEIGISGLSLDVRGVRVVSTEDVGDIWIVAREIYINDKSGSEVSPEPTDEKLTGTIIRTDLWSVSSGPESNLTDGNDSTCVYYDSDGSGNTNSDNSMVGDYIGLDFGSVQNVGRVRFVIGSGSSDDKWTNFKLQYSTDNTNWVDVNTYSSTNQRDIIEEDLGGVQARYIRFVNTVQIKKWLYFAELTAWSGSASVLYQSEVVKSITNPTGALADDSATLSADNVILRSGEFVGIALPSPRIITDIVANYTPVPGLVLKAGMNEAEMEIVNLNSRAAYTGAARYIRLENEGAQTVSFKLNELSVQSEEPLSGIHFLSSTIGGEANNEDARKLGTTGSWFDGNVNTKAKFCAPQVSGQHVTYDLGQTRQIRDLRLIVQDSQMDYPRHAKVQIAASADGLWTDVITIDTSAAASTSAGNDTEGGWVNISAYPNYKSLYSELGTPQDARYLRVLFTDNFSGRWLELNEIVINGGDTAQAEYVSAFSDPAFEADPAEGNADNTPDKLVDGDLTTAFIPDMTDETSGSLIYRVTDDTSIGQINVVSGNNSSATLSVRPAGETQFQEVGSLGGGLNEVPVPTGIANVAEIKLSWDNVTPTFYELVTIPREQVTTGGGQTTSAVETVPINSYSGDARKINFDENWKFNLGDASGAATAVFNDSAWRTVNLPHDYSIEGEYTSAGEPESGWLRGGVGWYRKSFTVDPSWAGKTVTIDFGGVYMDCEVYLNGTKLGEHHYGYSPFSFVLTGLKTNGENVIAVKTDDAYPSSRWYSGAGIYRSVNLTVTDPVHVAKYGTKVTTTNAGAVSVTTTVQNDGTSTASVTVEQAIYELDSATYKKKVTAVATDTSAATSVNANATGEVTQSLTVSNPKLWNSWDKGDPNLYVLVTTVKQGSTVLDTYETEFGFRTINFDKDLGFQLNGENVKLKGVCQHHDQGGLGAEAWYRALERQVDILKDMGCNSIRVTHNPAADELIEICNRKGVLIIDEFFDGWHNYKNGNTGDFARWFGTEIADNNALVGKPADEKTWAHFVVETVTNRDKNAPCVIMYSLGNEIAEGARFDENFATNAENLIKWAQAVDTTRPLTYGQNGNNTGGLKTAVADKIHDAGGLIGINYRKGWNIATAHDDWGWKVYASETVSHVNTRGVYDRKDSQSDGGKGDGLLTSYDKSCVGWGNVASDGWYDTIIRDYSAGEFIWTGFDYIGEPTPWNSGAPWHDAAPKSSYFGAIDTNGLPKDNYWLYRAMWNEKSHTLHILPTWDREDLMIENGKVEVAVYTDAPMVKLYLNDVEVGSATSTTHTTDAGHVYRTFDAGTGAFDRKSGHQTLYATFNVTYAEGTLRAVACDASGNPKGSDWTGNCAGRSQVATTTGAARLVATADRTTIKNDGRDLSYITIDVVDAKGEIVNGAKNEITVSVTGDGIFMAMDNGVQPDHTSYQSKTWKAGAGRVVAIVQSTKKAGSFTLTATADGLTPATVTVNTAGVTHETGGTNPVSYDITKTYYVQKGVEPKLPTQVQVTLGNGAKETKSVTWASYDPELLNTVGSEFSISGVIADHNVPASVSVVVLDQVVALLNYSTAVKPGEPPVLPAARPAVMADGTVVNAQFEVNWNMTGLDFTTPGIVEVPGTAENVFGKEMAVTAYVRVAKERIEESGNVVSTAHLTENAGDANIENLRDSNTATAWTGSDDVIFVYDTFQGFCKFKLTYSGTVPTSGVTIYTSNNSVASEAIWEELDDATVNTRGKTVTYQLPEIRNRVMVKITFDHEVSLAEVELISGTSLFPVGNTAKLDDLEINGDLITSEQKASGQISTSATMAHLRPISDDNVALTILPETSDSKVIIVTESEDHTDRFKYVIQLDDIPEYPYDQTTVSTPSQQTPADKNVEGPVEFAVDNNPRTYWHSNWNEDLTSSPKKRYIQLKLTDGDPVSILGLRYTPRPTLANGIVTKYEVWVSTTEPSSDVTSQAGFTKVDEGTWAHDTTVKTAVFDAVPAKYVRLYGVETKGGDNDTPNKFMSCSELRVLYQPSETDLSEGSVTVTPDTFNWKFGTAIRPGEGDEGATVTVTVHGKTLVRNQDYTLDYRNNEAPGTATLIVRAKSGSDYRGSIGATFQIVKPDLKITGYSPITVRTQAGKPPVLPETAEAIMDDGSHIPVPVTWDEVPESNYILPSINTYTVPGQLDTDEYAVVGDVKPTVNVQVYRSTSVDTVSMVTALGVMPTLPTEVTVQFADGSTDVRPIKAWNTAGVDVNTAGIYTITGEVVNIAKPATVTLRVADADAPTTWVPGDTNIALNTDSAANIFPMALAFWSSGDNNPYQAIKGQTTGSTSGANRWSDWEKNTSHASPKPWMGVAFETSTQDVTRKDDQVLTLVPHKVSKAKVMFVDENGSTTGNVTFPQEYKLQYYTGSVTGLTFSTKISGEPATTGNGHVRQWTGSPLLDDANWADVTLKNAAAYPTVPIENGKMLEIEFEAVDTAILRVLCTPKSGKWVGIQALEVYEAVAVPAANDDFTVTSITLGGEEKKTDFTVDANDPNTYVLEVLLDEEVTTAPELAIAVNPNDNASVSITQAARIDGLPQVGAAWAQASVTSEDGSKTVNYIVKFTHRGGASGYFLTLNVTDATRADKVTLDPEYGAPGTEVTIKPTPGYELVNPLARITSGVNEGIAVTITNGTFLIPAGDVTVTTGVQPITYTLTYLDCGSERPGPKSYNVESSAFTLAQPTKAGYTFLGWIGGGLTLPTKVVTITPGTGANHDRGSRTYTAMWQQNGSIGGGGGNNGGGSSGGSGVTVPVGDVTVTTKNPDGSTTVTTTTPGGLVSAVTTAKDGSQSAVIQIPQNSGSDVVAVMPKLDVNSEKTPEVTVDNSTGRSTTVTVPVNGGNTIVAVRQNPDGSETVIPYSIVDENGLRVKVEDGQQTLKLVDNKKTFEDVSADHWAADSVSFVSSRELFNGMGSATTFAPTVNMDRAMMTTVLWRLAEKPGSALETVFDDVVPGSYYEPAVAWGAATGVIKGTDNGFAPSAPVTREMLAVMLYRAAGSPAVVDELPRRFTDGAQVADWAQEAMIWCVQNDIIKGYPDNTLGSKNVATRAEVAAMLQRFVAHQV